MSDTGTSKASGDNPFPKSYLIISVLTLVCALTGTLISLFTLHPQQEKLKKETVKLSQEIDKANRLNKAEGPRIAQAYFIINSDSVQELDTDTKLDPRAGPNLGRLPRLKIGDFTSSPPVQIEEWRELAKSDACDCRYFYDWTSKHAKESFYSIDARIIPKTMYLTIQQVGKLQADDIVLTVDRVKIKTITNDPPFEQAEFPRKSYDSVEKVDLRLSSLEKGYGLRVPVAARVDFEAKDLDSTGGLGGGGEPNEFYYGVMYLPRKLSYFDPFTEERVQIQIRPPMQNLLEMSATTAHAE